MHDPRFDKLAHGLVNFSTRLAAGDKVLIDAFDIPDEMTVALIRAARAAGAVPFVQTHHSRVAREMALGAQEEQLDVSSAIQLAQMKKMQAYIAVRGSHNITENVGCSCRKDEADRPQAQAGAGLAGEEDAVVRVALAFPVYGAAGGDEHGAV
jgi:leucyl aminopeptidase (aminopeptidase T)